MVTHVSSRCNSYFPTLWLPNFLKETPLPTVPDSFPSNHPSSDCSLTPEQTIQLGLLHQSLKRLLLLNLIDPNKVND